MVFNPVSAAESMRSISFAVLVILTVAVLVFNITNNPADSIQSCFAYGSGVGSLLTIGLWILAIAASLGALSASYQQVRPPETYKRALVWIVYLASVPALLLLPSSQSISEAVGVCANSNFFTYLTWYMMGIIAAAALFCVHILVHGVRYHQNRIEETISKSSHAAAKLHATHKQNAVELAGTIKALRSPLTNLRAQIESLLESISAKKVDEVKAALLKINESAAMMAQTIETQIDLSKIDAGHTDFTTTDLNLRDTVEIICDQLRPTILKKGLILLMRTNLTSQSIIHADRTRVHQILRTLIAHAQDNTDRGTITVYVHDDTKSKQLYVDIIDTGRRMSKDKIQTVFSKNSKSNDGAQGRFADPELCLAQKLAATMGGTISAHDGGEGKGLRVTLMLPLMQ